jgi:hypothetical protein
MRELIELRRRTALLALILLSPWPGSARWNTAA